MIENIQLTALMFAVITGILPNMLKNFDVHIAWMVGILSTMTISYAVLIVSTLMIIWAD